MHLRIFRGLLARHEKLFIGSNAKRYSKLSYWHNAVSEPLRPLTLGQLLEETSRKHGDKYAVISTHQKKKIKFKEVLEEADRLAAGFSSLGFVPGDRIGIWAPNLIEWYVAFMACARGGFISVGLNPAYQAKEIEFCINKVGVKGIICAQTFKKQNYYELLNSICKELPESEPGKINSANLPSLKNLVFISDDKLSGAYTYSDILNLGDKGNHRNGIKRNQELINVDGPCQIIFTSGTTSSPKAVILSHFNVVNNGFYVGRRNELERKPHKICVQVPLFHVFGSVIATSAALNHGATMVLPSAKFDPDRSLDALRDERCTAIFGTPTMYVDLVRVQRERKEDICAEIALSGGSPCSPHLFKSMLEVLNVKRVKSVYGLSETTSAVYQSLSGDGEYETTETVGYLHEHMEAKVIDDNDHIVPMGVPGELCLRGYTTMLGYWGDSKKTQEVIDASRWLRTGDQFIMEENGYGRIVGRLKDMVIRGGENISPKEVEDLLNTHPDILESQVIGLPHERLGEEVCVCVRAKEGKSLTLDEIRQYCEGKLARYKIPTVLKIMDSFPTTMSGKVQKFKLVEIVKNQG